MKHSTFAVMLLTFSTLAHAGDKHGAGGAVASASANAVAAPVINVNVPDGSGGGGAAFRSAQPTTSGDVVSDTQITNAPAIDAYGSPISCRTSMGGSGGVGGTVAGVVFGFDDDQCNARAALPIVERLYGTEIAREYAADHIDGLKDTLERVSGRGKAEQPVASTYRPFQ